MAFSAEELSNWISWSDVCTWASEYDARAEHAVFSCPFDGVQSVGMQGIFLYLFIATDSVSEEPHNISIS